MKLLSLLAFSTLAASPVFAEETRHLGSHEHGVGQLDIAFDGKQVAMELHAPGADIVGFEYAAESAKDLATVKAALLVLAQPLDLFIMPDTAQCRVTEAHAELESEDSHKEQDAENHGHDDHEEDEGHGHEESESHTEFHAEYMLECADVTALNEISFAYFTAFPNALEVEVQVVSDTGATAFEVERDTPTLDLSDLN